MAPKAKKQKNENLKEEHVLQAVIIADNFNVRFGPVTLKKPRVKNLMTFSIYVDLVKFKVDKEHGIPGIITGTHAIPCPWVYFPLPHDNTTKFRPTQTIINLLCVSSL